MKEIEKEWFIDVPWGKLALVAWGNPNGEPVLMVHGRQDSAATFIPVLEHLPDNYYYVAVDLPGHGKSDPFPIGMMINRFQFVVGVDYAVQHLKWTKFIYVAHSMGSGIGLLYNAIYPNKITKFILFDPVTSIQRMQNEDFEEFFKDFYANYYDNYKKYNTNDKIYTRRQALDAVMKARGLNEEQASIVLSRNLKKIGEDEYKLSWDRRLKTAAPENFGLDYYVQLFTVSVPPILVISATRSQGYEKGERGAQIIMEHLKESSPDFHHAIVEGNHDIHLMLPEKVAGIVIPFLQRKLDVKAKL